jgi:hypothetical protein
VNLFSQAFAECWPQSVESSRHAERPPASARYRSGIFEQPEKHAVNDDAKGSKAPPPVFSGAPQRDLEQRLKERPHDDDAKADVGSDESMDASDPPAAAQPGCSDEPVPSSSFPQD